MGLAGRDGRQTPAPIFSSLSCRIPELPRGRWTAAPATCWQRLDRLSGSLCFSGAGDACPCAAGGGDVKTVPCSTYYLHEAKRTPGLLFGPVLLGRLFGVLCQRGLKAGGEVGGSVGADSMFSPLNTTAEPRLMYEPLPP